MGNLLARLNVILVILYAAVFFPLWFGWFRGQEVSLPWVKAFSRGLAAERQKVNARAQFVYLNQLMPTQYTDLLEPESVAKPDLMSLKEYTDYYMQAAQALPAPFNADAYALMGYCHYKGGRLDEASASYLKSIELNPAVIWNYHNLAVLHFKKGDYEKTALLVNQELQINPETALRIVASSKIYTDIIRDMKSEIDWSARLKGTYSDAGRMLVISLYRLRRFPETLQTAEYAIKAGFEPQAFFYYYTGLALQSAGEEQKAKPFLEAVPAAAQQADVFTGQDLSVRIF
jgi:tetratricopeptide (TPR) repeat protein